MAELLCSHHGWPLGVVTEHSRAGAAGGLRCVLDSLLRRTPAIRYEGPDPADYRTLVLVSPIWMYRLAGPMRTFLTLHRGHLQRVAVVSTMNAGGASNAVAEVARLVGRPPVLAEAFLQREIDDGSGTGRAIAFGDRLLSGQPVAEPAARVAPQA